jgi:hypothetical protein
MPRGTTGTGRLLLLLAAALVALTVVGCGGGGGSSTSTGASGNIQTPGVEADKGDRAAVSAALRGYFDARAHGDWARSCTYLAARTKKELEQFTSLTPALRGAACGKLVGAVTAAMPADQRARSTAAVTAIPSVRIKGDTAYVTYRTAGGIQSTIVMVREGSDWKLGALVGSNTS